MLSFEWFRDAGEDRVCIIRHPDVPGLGIVGAVELYRHKVNGLRTLSYKVNVLGRKRGIVGSHEQAEALARDVYAAITAPAFVPTSAQADELSIPSF